MSLIPCPDCAKEHSDRAPACPGCGRPATFSATVVEQTGKIFKLAQVGGLILMLFGLLLLALDGGAFAIFTVGLGVLLFGGGYLGAWWFHE